MEAQAQRPAPILWRTGSAFHIRYQMDADQLLSYSALVAGACDMTSNFRFRSLIDIGHCVSGARAECRSAFSDGPNYAIGRNKIVQSLLTSYQVPEEIALAVHTNPACAPH
jgi:hypothetical protein